MTREIDIDETVDLPALLIDLGNADEVVFLRGGHEVGRLRPANAPTAENLPPMVLPVAEYPDDYELA